MTESHDLGPIGDRVLFEDEQIRVWEMVLEPGERSPMHHHEYDYIVVVVEGDHVTVEPLGDNSKSASVAPGHSVLLRKGGTEVAANSGAVRYRDVQIELLDS
jgi:predicted metal-dependent enzyme (double-stranded beta helix superfamily)